MVVIVTVDVHLPQKKLIQPEFLCGCGRPPASRKCLGGEHNGRMFYRCGNGWVESSDGLNEKLWWKRVSKFTFPFFDVNNISMKVYIFCNIACRGKTVDPRTPMGPEPLLVRRGAEIARRADRGKAHKQFYPASELSGEIILLLLLVCVY